MPTCRPLEKREIEAMLQNFKGRTKDRDRALFVFGLMTGLRISELLTVTVGDVVSGGDIKHRVTISRVNTKGKIKSHTADLNAAAREYIRAAVESLQRKGFFSSTSPLFRSMRKTGAAITREQACRIISDCARRSGVSGVVATHSMRKTFAHNIHQTFLALHASGERIDPLLATSRALGHTSVQNTAFYLPSAEILHAQAVSGLSALIPGHKRKTRKTA